MAIGVQETKLVGRGGVLCGAVVKLGLRPMIMVLHLAAVAIAVSVGIK